MTDPKLLIDPTASVIDRNSSIRAIQLIHRALLSHMFTLRQAKSKLRKTHIEGEPFDIEFDSTSQLAKDIGTFLKAKQNA